MFSILLVVIVFAVAEGAPYEQCFSGGMKILTIAESRKSFPKLCLRDDVSMIKTESSAVKKEEEHTIFKNEAYRKLLIPEWKDCKPEKKELGDIMILEITESGEILAKTYACFAECTITIDKENGQLIFHTDKLNHYSIMGSTTTRGWFKSNAIISLKHTCENIKIQCGQKHLQVHACFKEHIECKQYLHNTILPGYMANSICHNAEVIILLVFVITIYCILALLMKTYLCYIMLPVFIPFCYTYGRVYNKACKVCNGCGLAYHPFTSCGSVCVCGTRYESSERMKIHRTQGLCSGYKSLRTARRLCKSKGCGFLLAVLLSIFALSFVTPVGAECQDMIDINDLPDILTSANNHLFMHKILIYIILGLNCFCLVSVTALFIIVARHGHTILRLFVYKCDSCKMLHEKNRLIIEDGYSSACGGCTCGCPDDPPMNAYHQISSLCVSKYIIKLLKICLYISLTCLLSTSVTAVVGVAAEEPTLQPILCDSYENFENCTGIGLYTTLCNGKTKPMTNEEIKNSLTENFLFTEAEVKLIGDLSGEYSLTKSAIDGSDNMHIRLMLEAKYLSKYCAVDSNLISNSINSLVAWKAACKLQEMRICIHYSLYKPCKCVFENRDCSSVNRGNEGTYGFTLGRISNTIVTEDLKKMFLLVNYLLPGNTGPYLLYLLENNMFAEAGNLTIKYMEHFKNDMSTKSFFLMMTDMFANLYNTGHSLPSAEPRTVSRKLEIETEFPTGIKQNHLFIDPEKKQCHNPMYMKCFARRTLAEVSTYYLLCDKIVGRSHTPKDRTVHKWDNNIVYMGTTSDILCYLDKTCLKNFISIEQVDLDKLKKPSVICRMQKLPEIDNPHNIYIKSCKPLKTGVCRLQGSRVFLNLCPNNLYYMQLVRGIQDPDSDIGFLCFTANCNPQFPIHPDSLEGCRFNIPRTIPLQPDIKQIQDLKQFNEYTKNKLFSSLTILNYKPTAYLTHLKPNFQSITTKGIETASGLDDAYITMDLQALSGTAHGYHVTTSDNNLLFDLIITIQNSNISSTYSYEYTTGPTIDFNSVHSEKCTGRCPELGPRMLEYTNPDWMPFTREGTSAWGCEEFGCFAIGEGCIAGACKDIIKPEAEVYKKITDEINSVTICFSDSIKSYCKVVTSAEADITDSIELQYKTVESFKLPNRLLVKDHKIYHGQINPLGEFGKYCGNVQLRNNTVIGVGIPVFDYRCHAMSRKDITIRKCYDNNYKSCLNLDALDTMDHEFIDLRTIKINQYNKITGQLSVKLKLGSLNFKLFTEKPELDIKTECLGCKKCIQSVICKLTVISDIETTCTVESNCISFMSRILIDPRQKEHNLKLNCDSLQSGEQVKLKICNTNINTELIPEAGRELLELAGLGQTAYVVEHDKRCGTWICKVYEEGFSFLWDPIKNWLGSYLWTFYIIIIVVIIMMFSYYILIPVMGKVRDNLKKHEIAYRKEM